MVSTQFNTLFFLAFSVMAGLGLGASAAVLDPGHGLARRVTGDVQQHHRLAKRFSNTKWSFYDVGLGACGKTNVASDYIVALNSQQFGSGYPGPNCFKQIKLSYGGKTAVATIMDECPGCPYGGLDLSRGLFTHFAIEDVGIIYGEWSFIDGSSGSGSGSTTTTTTKAAVVVPTTTSTKQTAPVVTPTTTTTTQKQAWVAPTTTTSSTKKWVAPTTTTSTKQWVAPTTSSTKKEWVAPTTTVAISSPTKKVAVPTTTTSSSSSVAPARMSTSRVASALASTITSNAKAAPSSSSSPSAKPHSLAAALSSSASLASSFSSVVLPSASASASLNTTEANIQNNIELISDLLVRLGELITTALEKDGKTTSS